MTVYARIFYTRHALERMQQRRISKLDVEAALRFGDGHPDTDETWEYEYLTVQGTTVRVIVYEQGDDALVVTVVKLRKHT